MFGVSLGPLERRRLLAASGYAELGLYQEALEELRGLSEGAQQEVPVLAAWVELYQSWSKWDEARAVAERLTQLEPDQPSWVVALAYTTRRAHSLRAAREVLLAGWARFPNFALIGYNLACYEAQLGDLGTAARLLKRAVELDADLGKLAKTDPDLAPLWGGQGW